jgi:hypothetical protein
MIKRDKKLQSKYQARLFFHIIPHSTNGILSKTTEKMKGKNKC